MSDLPLFPVPAGHFWGKLNPRNNPTEWHPLIAHSADVAAVLERLLESDSPLGSRLAATVGLDVLRPADRARLVFLAALHDIGKTSHGFQTKVRPKGERGSWKKRGHVKVLLESMDYLALKDAVIHEVLPRVSDDLQAGAILFAGGISHHGRPWPPEVVPGRSELWKPDGSGRDPLTEIYRLIRHAAAWTGVDEYRQCEFLTVTAPFTHLFAGALTLADWIGSTTTAFSFTPEADGDPDSYWSQAQRRAADACARIGLVPKTSVVSLEGLPLLKELFPKTFREELHEPTKLQRHVSEMDLPRPGSRVLIESETGSGKTEAALALYARLRRAGHVGGLMFALPTRATASAMHERIVSALECMYKDSNRPTLALAVGGQQPYAASESEALNGDSQTWPDRADRELTTWASSGSKKFLAAEIVVGTLDQVLLAGLPVRHAHLRLAALSRHLLVVDELHSFDRYMGQILSRVLAIHSGAGGIALFMSATLSSAERVRFGGGLISDIETASRLAYPTVAVCPRPGTAWADTPLPSGAVPKRVHWRIVSSDVGLAEAVVAAEAGGRVCILRNTVRGARETVAALREQRQDKWIWRPLHADHTPAYHSRYTIPDRLALDTAVLANFGKAAAMVNSGVILVATQVVEQSLDVDFDLLVTDICPVDVLLQRIGREHRHRQRDSLRPLDYRAPQVFVIAPGDGFTPKLRARAASLGWGENRPYPNYADGELTFRLIAARPTIEIPSDNRSLVEAVYHPDARDRLREDTAWDDYLLKAEGAELGQECHGREVALKFEQTYTACAAQFNKEQERTARTRLGDDSIRIDLPEKVCCWYSTGAAPVRSVDLPLWALPKSEAGDPLTEVEQMEIDGMGITRVHIAGREFRYTPDGWEW